CCGGAGGGAGGSVLVNAASLAGLGVVQADGGPGTPGWAGGSGGRVALYAATIDGGLLSRTQAAGATSTSSNAAAWGAAGTVFVKLDGATVGDLIVDNGGLASSQYTELVPVGSGTLTAVGSNTVGDSLADFHHDLAGVGLVVAGGSATPYPITANAHHGQ